MSIIDKQRIAAVRTLEALGYIFTLADGWSPPAAADGGDVSPLAAEADAMHALLVERADEIGGYPDCSPEDTELKSITDVLAAYEAKRWPSGKTAGGKG
jgi:hypothetical protein